MLLGTSCAYLAKARSDLYRVVKDFCKGVRVHRHSRIDARGHSHHQQSWTDLIHEQRAQRSGQQRHIGLRKRRQGALQQDVQVT